MSDDEFLAA